MDVEANNKITSKIRNYILNGLSPILFRKIHESWEPLRWSLDEWGRLVTEGESDSRKVNVRCGKKCFQGIQWESDCESLELDWETLARWDDAEEIGVGNLTNKNKDCWIYYDYKHMRQFLNESQLKKFEWSKLGFPERHGNKSTLWIGSQGSYTPCHFDTYGCNLVCQVFGGKNWTLFPPEDTDALRPTRVPYEESSVYSQVNLLDTKDVEDLHGCSPLKVTLEPGDVLYVPPKWWHFVQAESFSVSVNTWIELEGDASTRLDEAIVRSLMGCVTSNISLDSVPAFLNPNEGDILELSESAINQMLGASIAEAMHSEDEIPTKKRKKSEVDPQEPAAASAATNLEILKAEFPCIQELEPFRFTYQAPIRFNTETPTRFTQTPTTLTQTPARCTQLPTECTPTSTPLSSDSCEHLSGSSTYLGHLVNAITHPDILKLISAQFIKNIQQDREES